MIKIMFFNIKCHIFKFQMIFFLNSNTIGIIVRFGINSLENKSFLNFYFYFLNSQKGKLMEAPKNGSLN